MNTTVNSISGPVNCIKCPYLYKYPTISTAYTSCISYMCGYPFKSSSVFISTDSNNTPKSYNCPINTFNRHYS